MKSISFQKFSSKIKIDEFYSRFKSNGYNKISFLLGAGVSTSAGIPDFRSDEGIYRRIAEKYNMKNPELIFDLSFFKENPQILYDYYSYVPEFKCYEPTFTHKFLKFVENKGLLNIIFTQNVDCLEIKAGVSRDKIVFAHGNRNEANCVVCKNKVPPENITKGIKTGQVYYCEKCRGPCKFSVVFFGESMPQQFFSRRTELYNSDLNFIVGTSLKVKPFAYLPSYFDKNCTTIIINKEDINSNIVSIDNKDNFIIVKEEADNFFKNLVNISDWTEEFSV